MAYITRANSFKIIKKIDYHKVQLSGDVYKNEISFFSKYEEHNLIGIKELISNPSKFYNDYFSIMKKNDMKEFIFEGGGSAYHKSSACPKLNSDFRNYKIPNEIYKKGEDKIREYRDWVKQHLYLLENGKADVFKIRCKAKFLLDILPEVVDYENSGIYTIDNINLDSLEKKIDCLLLGAMNFIQNNETILNRFKKLTYIVERENFPFDNKTGYSKEEVISVLRKFHFTYKKPIEKLLEQWYRVKHNPRLVFEGYLLEQLGFSPCNTCHAEDFIGEDDKNEYFNSNVDNSLKNLLMKVPIPTLDDYYSDWFSTVDENCYGNDGDRTIIEGESCYEFIVDDLPF